MRDTVPVAGTDHASISCANDSPGGSRLIANTRYGIFSRTDLSGRQRNWGDCYASTRAAGVSVEKQEVAERFTMDENI